MHNYLYIIEYVKSFLFLNLRFIKLNLLITLLKQNMICNIMYTNKFLLLCFFKRILIINHIDHVRSLSHVAIRSSDRSRALKLNIVSILYYQLINFYQSYPGVLRFVMLKLHILHLWTRMCLICSILICIN